MHRRGRSRRGRQGDPRQAADATARITHRNTQVSDIAGREDDAHWHAGGLYINRNDPTLLLPQCHGIGWTLHLAHPAAWLLLAALIAVPVLLLIATR